MMKKLFILTGILVFLAAACCSASAQTTGNQVGDPTTYLTADQLAKYEADIRIAELQKKLDTYGSWVGVGGEVGNAIEEGLSAVVGVADEFTGTDVGKFTMILVAWKVIGKDVVRIFLGLLWFFAITWMFLKVYKNTYQPKRVLTKNPGFFKYPKEYEAVVPEDDWEGYNAVKIVMLFLYAGAIGITYAIMFAG